MCRFGKTMSVCLFVAALLYTAPNVEISIYSTCKRISQKLLRNCLKFLALIYDVLREKPLEFSRKSMDEVEIIGDESGTDFRKLNSYPSKVTHQRPCCAHQKSLSAQKSLSSALTSTYTHHMPDAPRMCKKTPTPHTRLRIASRARACAEMRARKKNPTPTPTCESHHRLPRMCRNASSKKKPKPHTHLRIPSPTPTHVQKCELEKKTQPPHPPANRSGTRACVEMRAQKTNSGRCGLWVFLELRYFTVRISKDYCDRAMRYMMRLQLSLLLGTRCMRLNGENASRVMKRARVPGHEWHCGR